MRIAAGVLAAALLGCVIRLHPAHRMELDEAFAFAPPIVTTAEVSDNAQPDTLAEEEPTANLEDERGGRPRAARTELASLLPTGPRRFFVLPVPRRARVEPVNLPAPPVIQVARVESPRMPWSTPSLQPPRKNAFKKIVSALAVPFKRT